MQKIGNVTFSFVGGKQTSYEAGREFARLVYGALLRRQKRIQANENNIVPVINQSAQRQIKRKERRSPVGDSVHAADKKNMTVLEYLEFRRILDYGNTRSKEALAERYVQVLYEKENMKKKATHNLSCAESHGSKSDTPDKPAARRMKSPAKK